MQARWKVASPCDIFEKLFQPFFCSGLALHSIPSEPFCSTVHFVYQCIHGRVQMRYHEVGNGIGLPNCSILGHQAPLKTRKGSKQSNVFVGCCSRNELGNRHTCFGSVRLSSHYAHRPPSPLPWHGQKIVPFGTFPVPCQGRGGASIGVVRA